MMRAGAALALCSVVFACATGIEGDGGELDGDGGDASMGGAGGNGKTDDPMMTTTSSSTTGGGGMGGMAPECDPPGHLCGGICVGNTPATGCYQSSTCASCPTPTNGTATCTMDGQCAAQCNSPYVPNGASCICPMQCCSDADCGGGGSVCQSGTCTTPQTCDQVQCTAICLIQGLFGICQGNQCLCL